MPTIREQLIGAWRLVSYEVHNADGSVVQPMGQDVEGLILYGADGFVSANLMVPGRPPYSGGAAASATAAQLAAAAAGYFAYAGRFEVDEATRTVMHRVEVALMPNLAGTTQRRRVQLDGPRLTLRGDPSPAGATPLIIWDRVS